VLAVRKDCPPFALSSPVHRTARFPPSISSRPYRSNPREQNSSFPLKSDAEVTELLPACRPSGSWPDHSIQARLSVPIRRHYFRIAAIAELSCLAVKSLS